MKKILIPILMLCSIPLFSQKLEELKSGSPLRKTLFNLSRPNAEREFGQSVEFFGGSMRKVGNFIFVFANVQQKGGRELDSQKVKLAAPFDNNYQAIYKNIGGKWTILREKMGCTDVCWLEWSDEKNLKLPKGLLPNQ